jgi:hypothetical protein
MMTAWMLRLRAECSFSAARCSSNLASTGSRNAKLFPVPVGACTSTPVWLYRCRNGMTRCWMRLGAVTPRDASRPTNAEGTPSSLKERYNEDSPTAAAVEEEEAEVEEEEEGFAEASLEGVVVVSAALAAAAGEAGCAEPAVAAAGWPAVEKCLRGSAARHAHVCSGAGMAAANGSACCRWRMLCVRCVGRSRRNAAMAVARRAVRCMTSAVNGTRESDARCQTQPGHRHGD